MTTVVHRCPMDDSNLMPCCGLPPGERILDRMTIDDALVTCSRCRCGHPRYEHHGEPGRGPCMHSTEAETWACDCSEYQPPEWHCTTDGVTEPCGDCDGCRYDQSVADLARSAAEPLPHCDEHSEYTPGCDGCLQRVSAVIGDAGGAIVMFSPEQVASIQRMDAAKQRLRELGVRHVDLGPCSHGYVAGVRIQRGRSHKEFVAHGAPSPAQALEELVLQIEALPPEKRRQRRKGKR